jgi:hypothetical protein
MALETRINRATGLETRAYGFDPRMLDSLGGRSWSDQFKSSPSVASELYSLSRLPVRQRLVHEAFLSGLTDPKDIAETTGLRVPEVEKEMEDLGLTDAVKAPKVRKRRWHV